MSGRRPVRLLLDPAISVALRALPSGNFARISSTSWPGNVVRNRRKRDNEAIVQRHFATWLMLLK
jgi:hypothetical protein